MFFFWNYCLKLLTWDFDMHWVYVFVFFVNSFKIFMECISLCQKNFFKHRYFTRMQYKIITIAIHVAALLCFFSMFLQTFSLVIATRFSSLFLLCMNSFDDFCHFYAKFICGDRCVEIDLYFVGGLVELILICFSRFFWHFMV